MNRHGQMFSVFVLTVALIALGSGLILAQTTAAKLLGTVKDESGGVLPGVSVVVRHIDTAASRTALTDDEGRYQVSNLPLGNYEVQAELVGFQTALRTGITLSVGQEAVVDLILYIGEISETVTVTGETALVEATASTIRALVDERQIRDLPLNGRDFTQLVTLQEGVYAPPTMVRGINAVAGTGARISISGARPNQNSFRLDGSDVQDAQQRTPAGVSGTTLGVAAVREFSILTNTYSAEYGGRGGGIINAVTKSGTNEFHGSVFAFHRNDNLDARNFFDPGDNPEFKRNQFGFTAGGPIVKNRTFFFGAYEGLRDRLGLTQISNTLSADGRQGIVGGITIPIDPRVQPYVDLYPLPNGTDFGDGRGEFIRSLSRPTDEDYILIKLDHILSDTDSLFVRYVNDESSIVDFRPFPGFENVGATERHFATIEHRRTFSPILLNEFRFSFNRSVVGTTAEQSLQLDPSLSFAPGIPMGGISVGGLAAYGSHWLSDRILTNNVFEYIDNVSYSRGRHSIRFGAEVKRIQFNPFSHFAKNGFYFFNSVAAFLQADSRSLSITLPGSDPHRGWRLTYLGVFIQDDFQITPNLTLNLGLRQELTTEPWEVNGKSTTLVNPDSDTAMTVTKTLYDNPCLLCLSPRLGLAWDAFGDGKTAVRGGFGIFRTILMPIDWIFAGTNPPPFMLRTSLSGAFFPDSLQAVEEALAIQPNIPFFIQTLSTDVDQPYMYKYNLNIQRSLGQDLMFTIGYSGSKSVHISREKMVNVAEFEVLADGRRFFQAGAPRRNPNFGAISWARHDTSALYNALQVLVRKRFSQGLQFQMSYTFGKTMDASSGSQGSSEVPGATTGSADPFDWKRDWGLAGFHVKNAFVSNFSYDIPMNPQSKVMDLLLGGWTVNGIVTLADGAPSTFRNRINRARSRIFAPSGGTERPDLRSGGDNNPVLDTRDPRKYWDGSQLELQEAGFFGNLGKGTALNPGVATFDFSLLKDFSFGDTGSSLQFRSEFFNIFNRANFSRPNNAVFINATGIPSASFGRITQTTTTGRQIQFALKVLF